jgi:hypothetical protein
LPQAPPTGEPAVGRNDLPQAPPTGEHAVGRNDLPRHQELSQESEDGRSGLSRLVSACHRSPISGTSDQPGVSGSCEGEIVTEDKKVLICRTYGQKVENMPHDVKHEVCLMLNVKQRIKGNDYIRVADKVGLKYYEVNNLPTENPMDGVFDVMISQVKTVKYFVDILHRIGRGDVINKMYEMALLETSNSTDG